MIPELRLALRRLARTPGFALTVVLTVAIAIGANGTIFSAVRALLDRPLPFHEGDRLVWVYGRASVDGPRGKPTGDEAGSIAVQTSTYDGVAVIGDRAFLRVTGNRRERWNGLWVTPSLFAVLGIQPALGRPITLDDARAGARVMMIGHERWTRDLGGDSTVVGRPIHFYDGHTYTVAGILPPRLEFPIGQMPQSGNGSGFVVGVQDFWILGQEGDELPGGTVIARLRRDVTPAAATAQAAVLGRRLLAEGLITDSARSMEIVPLRDQALGLVRPGLRLAQGFAVLMLLLACANLANLVLLRTHAREGEHAVQAALGASTRAIVSGIVTEVALLTAAGGTLGLALAALARETVRLLAAGSVPMIERIATDWPVALFTVAMTALVALVVAVVPAVVIARGNLQATLLSGGRSHTATRRHARLRTALVSSQVALALMLSVGAALIATSFARLMSVDAGYDPHGVVTADVEVFDHPSPAEFYRDLDRRLRSLPGVKAVGLIHSTPLTGKWTFADPFVIAGRPEDPSTAPLVSGAFVGFDYFGAMNTPVVAGRKFTEQEDMAGNAPVLMINESAARRFFPGRSPLGESVLLAGKARRIVGVVKDMRDVRLDAPPEPQWFQPLFGSGTQLIVRVAGDASDAIPMLRREMLAADSRFVVNGIGSLDDIVATTVTERRMAMRLLSALAAIALGMASIGLYGVVSFNVARRHREFGVRSALGAQRHALLGMVLREGIGMALTGIAIGVGLSVWLTRVLERLLFQVSPTEPSTITMIAGLLLLVAVCASLVPAWRGASVDPAMALRADT
jgi:putative ABC transport system permease protein